MDDTNETAILPQPTIDLQYAVEAYLMTGGVIQYIPNGVSGKPGKQQTEVDDIEVINARKAEHLKELIVKGAGISALQYAMKMNKRELRRIATEQNIKIPFYRTLPRYARRPSPEKIMDDNTAGTIIHLSLLGHLPLEIAQVLGIRVRQVWAIAKEYRFSLKTPTDQE